ncbi:SH3 domain-containing protein [Paracoccus sp. (in: a-proteobacteria)]|uniref:SH3 domain-containing protein n=1 Tax=Paracoccus sp. TaxID=267 RepID=UPI0026E10149|nr:SH3 domain-containing protein [Paracoccus sp. (in: a-proteobacteria)]MDO5648423.1 SH3 domain-containing protein [Paracoccus sp. (in: a-proteobacteria)]
MLRLGLLLVVTLVAMFGVLSVMGGDDLRSARRPAPEPVPVVETTPVPAPVAEPEVVTTEQTPEQVQQFPGPALRSSPEYAGRDVAPAAAVTALPDSDLPVMMVTGNRVNFRSGPSTNDGVVGALTNGARVHAIGPTDAAWVNIRDAQGREGFMSSQFLSLQ